MNLLCLQQSSIFEAYGGIEYYLHDFLTLLSEIVGPTNVTSLVPQRTAEFKSIPTSYQVVPVAQRTRGILNKLENRFSPALFAQARQLARTKGTTVILAGHVSLAPMALAISKLTGLPYWTMAYGLEVWGGMRTQDSWALRKSDKIISISHWTRNILETRGIAADKICVVHPCLPPDFQQVGPSSRDFPSGRPLRILTVSRLDSSEQYKGHDHVIRAMALIKQMRPEAVPKYTIQGTGNDKTRLQNLVFASGLEDQVTFLDRVESREALMTIYQDHDLFVMPSRFGCWNGRWKGEGFGIVYIEAGACGVPSIAYHCGGVTDIIQHEENGLLIKPDDIEALANALLMIHDVPSRLAQLGKRAREIAINRFSYESIRKEMLQLLQSGQGIAEVRPSSNPVDISHSTDVIS